jgi:hypothetical protein
MTTAATLLVCSASAQNSYNLSSMGANGRFVMLIDQSSGAQIGVYANQAPNMTVVVSDGWVDTVGAGMFLGAPGKSLDNGNYACAIVLRRENRVPALARLPVSCVSRGIWSDATVIGDSQVIDAQGKPITLGFAEPKSGALGSVEVSSKSMQEKRALSPDNDGSIVDGRLSLAGLGQINILFVSKLNSAQSYLIISPDQLRKLSELLAPEDSTELLQLLDAPRAAARAGTRQGKATAPAQQGIQVAKKAIQQAQQQLRVLGYEPGVADGAMGSRTIAAVKTFQSDKGLSITGELDQKTSDALGVK